LEAGYKPDVIVGDMDSVSDEALRSGAEVLVHGYIDGAAPGEARAEQLGVAYEVVRATGTSEDVALLLAHEKGSELIVAVGVAKTQVLAEGSNGNHIAQVAFLIERGLDPARATFIVAGDLAGMNVPALVERLFGEWRPSANRPRGVGHHGHGRRHLATGPARAPDWLGPDGGPDRARGRPATH